MVAEWSKTLKGLRSQVRIPARNYEIENSEVEILFYVGSPKEDIFLTTFYGLYFSHHFTHITNYNLSPF